MSAQSWSLIVLSYNEQASIERVLGDALALFRAHDREFEIIVIDDGSIDDSVAIIGNVTARHPEVRLITHERNRGIGEALRTGYFAARLENVAMIPGDGQFDIAELGPHLDPPAATIVSFCRPGRPSYSLFRKLLSATNRMINAALIGQNFADANWVKIYKTQALQRLHLRLHSSLIESEILAKLLRRGYRVVEVPSNYLPRVGGKSSAASAKNLMRVVPETMRLGRAVIADRLSLREM